MDFFLFFSRGGCASCLRAYLGARLLPQSYQYPNRSEGADRVGGQLRGDKECPFSGVTKSGRVWRKVPESDARSVPRSLTRVEYLLFCAKCHGAKCVGQVKYNHAYIDFNNKVSVAVASWIPDSDSCTIAVRAYVQCSCCL